ncbi:class I SAM-dependent methyltransferase [Saccharicrinis aurantiacus]|uniref:class I SAM-dependent methyltransferase n=1 Tax=Saccharicrinis aurantiacus TaxID=1849719 RepID=UPI002492511F|nr:class I SAM-dependent methyltransferase [Saccharicrinis aurantiacus]
MSTDYYSNKEQVEKYIDMTKGMSGIEIIDSLRPYLSDDAKLLELGTGPGNDWNILSKYYTVTGSDFSEEFMKHLSLQFPKSNFLQLDAATIEVDTHFDAIYSNKVLHHLKDDELASSIKRQAEILNDNGVICHSFWKGKGTENYNGMFVNLHTEEALSELLKEQFEILSTEEYKEFEDNDSIFIIARKL